MTCPKRLAPLALRCLAGSGPHTQKKRSNNGKRANLKFADGEQKPHRHIKIKLSRSQNCGFYYLFFLIDKFAPTWTVQGYSSTSAQLNAVFARGRRHRPAALGNQLSGALNPPYKEDVTIIQYCYFFRGCPLYLGRPLYLVMLSELQSVLLIKVC